MKACLKSEIPLEKKTMFQAWYYCMSYFRFQSLVKQTFHWYFCGLSFVLNGHFDYGFQYGGDQFLNFLFKNKK